MEPKVAHDKSSRSLAWQRIIIYFNHRGRNLKGDSGFKSHLMKSLKDCEN